MLNPKGRKTMRKLYDWWSGWFLSASLETNASLSSLKLSLPILQRNPAATEGIYPCVATALDANKKIMHNLHYTHGMFLNAGHVYIKWVYFQWLTLRVYIPDSLLIGQVVLVTVIINPPATEADSSLILAQG